nr:MAG TPA: hypothetical protein [Caudoviricetes sp.]
MSNAKARLARLGTTKYDFHFLPFCRLNNENLKNYFSNL